MTLVLFDQVHTLVRSEAASEGPAALTQIDVAEDRYRLALTLHSRRLAAGMTQQGLAGRSGIPHHRISEIENGCANPTLATLGALARALGAAITVR